MGELLALVGVIILAVLFVLAIIVVITVSVIAVLGHWLSIKFNACFSALFDSTNTGGM